MTIRIPAIPILLAALLLLAAGPALSQDKGKAEDQGAKKDGVSQKILLDKPVRAGDLVLYPGLKGDKDSYYYVVNKVSLGTHETGAPQFSFLRWVDNEAGDETGPGGGGIVHALVELGVTQEQLQEANAAIRKINPEGKVAGPVVFSAGRFALVSTAAVEEGGSNELTKQLVGVGKAPLLDGSKAAISILLTKQGAKVLWESFKTPTPDVSFSFEMQVDGFFSPYEATLTADLEQVQNHMSAGVKASYSYIGAEVEAAFDDLRKSGAIKLDVVGEDTKMDGLIDQAYAKIAALMFDEVPLDKGFQDPEVAKAKEKGVIGDLTKAAEDYAEAASGIGVTASFKMKRKQLKGTYRIDFNKFSTARLVLRFDENIGDLRQYWGNSNHFRQVNLEDPLFVQREIVAKLNGVDAEDFDDLINFVSVQLRKVHQSGDITDRELKIDRATFTEMGNRFPMEYGWKGDEDRTQWLSYQYKVHWGLEGGREVISEWEESDNGMIDLTPPLQKVTVSMDGSQDELQAADVRAAIVTLYYNPSGNKEVQRRETFRIDKGECARDVTILLPRDIEAYEYDIKWQGKDGKVTQGERQPGFGTLVYIDPPTV